MKEDNNIVFLGKKKVVDINSADSGELKEARKIINEKIFELHDKRKKIDVFHAVSFLPILIGEAALITMASRYLFSDILNYAKAVDLSTLLGILGSFYISVNCLTASFDRFKKKITKLEESDKEISKELQKRNRKEMGIKELESIEFNLTRTIPLDECKEHYKQMVIDDLLEHGADPKIINLPVIQGIFDYELTKPVNFMERRAFSYSPEYREIREDGTFDIAPCIKDYKPTFPIKYDYTRYVITYCKDGIKDHYILIECPREDLCYMGGVAIYLDREGNISELSKCVAYSGFVSYCPKKDKKLTLTKENKNE